MPLYASGLRSTFLHRSRKLPVISLNFFSFLWVPIGIYIASVSFYLHTAAQWNSFSACHSYAVFEKSKCHDSIVGPIHTASHIALFSQYPVFSHFFCYIFRRGESFVSEKRWTPLVNALYINRINSDCSYSYNM